MTSEIAFGLMIGVTGTVTFIMSQTFLWLIKREEKRDPSRINEAFKPTNYGHPFDVDYLIREAFKHEKPDNCTWHYNTRRDDRGDVVLDAKLVNSISGEEILIVKPFSLLKYDTYHKEGTARGSLSNTRYPSSYSAVASYEQRVDSRLGIITGSETIWHSERTALNILLFTHIKSAKAEAVDAILKHQTAQYVTKEGYVA